MSLFATVPAFIALAVIIVIPFIVGVYVYRDANRRGMNAMLWALVAALAPSLIGLIVYLLVRGNYRDLRCPECDTPVMETFVVCPKCGAKLRPSCPNCSMAVETDWKLCPKCAQPLPEYQPDIHPPVKAKDRSIGKVLAIVLIVPALLIAVLFLSLSSSFSAGSIGVRTTTTNEYYSDMEANGNGEIAQEVKEWVEDIDLRIKSAYALRYTHETDVGTDHYFLVYVPSVGEQNHTGVGQSSSIFGTTLNLELQPASGHKAFFNIITSSEEAPELRIKVGGEKLPCEVTTVDYNPTLFYIVPKYDELEPGATGFFMPERITVVKIEDNHNVGAVAVEAEDVAFDILVGIDSAPYLDIEHDMYSKPDGSGGYDFKDGFDIIIEYEVHEGLVLHEDMLHCLVLEQYGGYYLIDDRSDNGRFIREIDPVMFETLQSLFA